MARLARSEFFRRNYGAVPVQVEGQTRPLADFIDMVLTSTPERPAPYLKDAVVRRLASIGSANASIPIPIVDLVWTDFGRYAR